MRVKKEDEDDLAVAEDVSTKDVKKLVKQLEKEMIEAVRKLEFEKAALLRDQISFLRGEGDNRKLQSTSIGGVRKRKYGKNKEIPFKKIKSIGNYPFIFICLYRQLKPSL